MSSRFETDKFVHDENIKSLQRQLKTERKPATIVILKALLKEEQARSTLFVK